MSAYPPLVIANPSSTNAGNIQQMQAGDQIDPKWIPGNNNGTIALTLLAQLITNLASNGNVLLDQSLIDAATTIQQQLGTSSNPLPTSP